MQVSVYCPQKEMGCEWEGMLGSLSDHVGKCPKQVWKCGRCTFLGLLAEKEEHRSVCDQFPVSCPNECGVGQVKHCDLQQHLLDCPLQVVQCDYAAFRCTVTLPRRAMKEHLANSMQEHLLKVCAANLTLSQEMSRKMAEKDAQIMQLCQRMLDLEERVMEKVAGIEAAMQRVVVGTGEVKELVDTTGQTFSAIPPLVCLIPHFSELRANRRRWTSRLFYSHHMGYKMCMEVFPAGCKTNSYVSVLFYLLFDKNYELVRARWFVELHITFQVWNYTTGRWERECTCGSLPQKIFLKTGNTTESMRCTSTNMTYLPHSQLGPYLRDDTLRIRISNLRPVYK